MKPTDLAVYLSRFFTDHLAGERNASPNTIKGYRDVFKLLLRHCRDRLGIPPDRLTLRGLTAEVIRNFLTELAQRPRHCARTRNHRLAAVHSFFRYVQSEDPELLLQCQQVLAIPMQKAPSRPIEYLNADQLGAILLGFSWGVLTLFVLPAIALAGDGPLEAARRSLGIVTRRWETQVAGMVYVWLRPVLFVGVPGALMLLAGVVLALAGVELLGWSLARIPS